MTTTYAYENQHGKTLKHRLARRTDVFGTSIWTDILTQFQKHEDPVYFGDGAPAEEHIPVSRMKVASMQAWEDAPACLGYGDQQGYPELRQWVADFVSARQISCTADDVLIASGATQALDLACRALLEPGDTIVVENPTFLGAIEIFQTYEVTVVAIENRDDGMDIDELERLLASGVHPKFIYTIPTFQNPAGTTMPLAHRQRLVELARRYNVAVFEDDPYGNLRYSGEEIAPIRSLDSNVLYFGTFSKIVAPGIRVGYVIAPPEIMSMILAIREVTDISNERMMMRTIYHTVGDGFIDQHIVQMRDVYRSRRDAMLTALEKHMPEGCHWSRPDGGFFVWITLPETVDPDAFFDEAAEQGVIFFPGRWFDPTGEHATTMRLSFSTVPEDRIALGIERLGAALRKHLTM